MLNAVQQFADLRPVLNTHGELIFGFCCCHTYDNVLTEVHNRDCRKDVSK